MNAPDLNPESLHQLPDAVQEIMNEVGLWNTLHELLEHLGGADIPLDECNDLVELLDWTMAVLMAASAPLVQETFGNLYNQFSPIRDYISRSDWHSYTGHIPHILRELSTIPTTQPDYSVEAANQVTAALRTARRRIVASEASVRTKQEEVERSFQELAESHQVTLDDEAEALSTRFSRLKAVATGRFSNLRQAATDEQEALSGEMVALFDNLKETATGEHENLSEEMAALLEDLQDRYGFTAAQVLGGDHERAANAAHALAEAHKQASRLSMWLAVVWAGLIQVAVVMSIWVEELNEWLVSDEWLGVVGNYPIVGSPVVILLFIARREGKMASEHRQRHQRLQSLALQLKSWEPYLSTLATDVRQGLEKEITPKFFRGDAR